MAKDKGKKMKPSLETKDVVKIQDDAVKAKEVEAKDVPAFQLSTEGDCVRFLVRQSLGLTLITENSVVRRKRGPLSNSASFSFSSQVPSILARLLLEQDCGSTIPMNSLIVGTIHACSIAARIRLWIYHSDELSLL